MTATFDTESPTQRQIMLSFAYLAYTGSTMTTPTPEPAILQGINAAMPKIPPIAAPNDTWEVVWGPGVYTISGALYQENMMFVAQNLTDPTQFAIAIRGTNGDLDWLLEDLDILQMVSWPPGAPVASSGAMISESTSVGLQILLAMQGATANGPQTLIAFLTSQATRGINVCVTGHSLGGCLAGTLALYLLYQQGQPSTWDPSGQSTVSTVTFAAPTAGNAAFASQSDKAFAAGTPPPNWPPSLGTNCDPVRCTLDVAPMAWVATMLSSSSTSSPLFEIYGENINFSSLPFPWAYAWGKIESDVLPALAKAITTQGYAQIVNDAAPLTGSFNGTPPSMSNATLLSLLQAFVTQAAYQHSKSYPTLLLVPALLDPTIIVSAPVMNGAAG